MSLLQKLCFASLLLCSVVQAKVLLSSGDVVILSGATLPANVYSNPASATLGNPGNPRGQADVSSPVVDGKLRVGVFDEMLSTSPSTIVTLANGAQLLPSIRYDSFFLFFHQARPFTTSHTAVGSVTLDNKFVGCVTSDNFNNDGVREFETSPAFGHPNVTYPLLTDDEYKNGAAARGYEGGDLATGSGTTLQVSQTITQPGDYNRCFSATCITEQNEACSCSASLAYKGCVSAGSGTKTYASITSLIGSSDVAYTFSSTCLVSETSSVFQLHAGSCDGPNDGCTLNENGSITVETDKVVTLYVDITAGCSCDQPNVPLVLTPCGGCPNSKQLAADATSGSIESSGACACLTF